MRPPCPASVLLFLASLGLLAASTTRPEVAINSTFLHPLATQVQSNDTFNNAGHLFYDHFDDLVYLTRRGNPQALTITQHVLAQGHTPGECGCCSGGFKVAIFADGLLPPGFFEGLAHFTRTDQVRLLAAADDQLSESMDVDQWEEQLEQYLAAHPTLAAAWKEHHAQLALP
jgi:hypothetical protein